MSAAWQPGPRRPPTPRREVHLWRGAIAPDRARDPLREVLSRYLGLAPEAIVLERGATGKPALPGEPPALEFNLSHSAELALVAVAAGHPVGVDVESTARRRDFAALAARMLPAEVEESVRAAPPEQAGAIFYAAWSDYEARVKCGGGGIAGGPGAGPLASVAVDVGPGYAAALAVPGPAVPPLRLYLLD